MSRFLLLVLCTAALGAHAAEPVVAIARFVCDDKQATADTCDEPAWRRSALEGPEKSSTLFEHVWGGPEGAVWNGAAAQVTVRVGKQVVGAWWFAYGE
jgi:hypothetical protein